MRKIKKNIESGTDDRSVADSNFLATFKRKMLTQVQQFKIVGYPKYYFIAQEFFIFISCQEALLGILKLKYFSDGIFPPKIFVIYTIISGLKFSAFSTLFLNFVGLNQLSNKCMSVYYLRNCRSWKCLKKVL